MKSIIIVPGGPGLSNAYLDNLNQLTEVIQDCKVVYFEPATTSKEKIVLNQLLTRLQALIETCGDSKIYLIGHSFGCALINELFARQPNLVEKIEMYFAISLKISKENAHFSRKQRAIGIDPVQWQEAAKNENLFRKIWRSALPLYFFRRPSGRIVSKLLYGTYWVAAYDLIEECKDHLRVFEISDALPSKTVYICGAGDPLLTVADFAVANNRFASRAHLVNFAGHFPTLENTGVVINTLLQYIK